MVNITYEADEHTPLVLILADVARYEGVVAVSVSDAPPVDYQVISVANPTLTVKAFDESRDDLVGTGPELDLNLNEITALHIY